MYDSIVVGLGGMGSAAAAHLARRKQRIVGLEQFSPAHALGSSHGKTRIIRQAYYEDPAYVPLLLRAYELWHELERETGQTLLRRTGGLMVGLPDSPLVAGSQRSAREHGLAHDVLDAREMRRRFPATNPRAGEVGVFELPAGMLFPERCVQAHLDSAARGGAELHFDTPVSDWGMTEHGAAYATTTAGDRFEAGNLLVCAGAWVERWASQMGVPIRIERNVMHWFEGAPAALAELQELPVFILDRAGSPALYGFPYIEGQGLKAAFHHSGTYTTPDALERTVKPAEAAPVQAALAQWLPAAATRCIESVACMYSLTPDEHFVVGLHPTLPNVVVAAGFSGHGFKFCSVMGEIMADLAMQRATRHPIELFSPTRFKR